jgi:hypothetical protein
MSSAQSSSSLAADAPRYGVNAADAFYALNISGTGAPTVNQIVAGTNVTISPSGGTGVVTINASSTNNVSALNGETGNVNITSSNGTVLVTTPGTGTINLAIPSAEITKYIPTGGADVPIPDGSGSGDVTVISISDVTVGKIYNWNLLVSYGAGKDGSGVMINPAVQSPQIYYRWYFQGAQPPGGTLAVAPVVNNSASNLASLLYQSGATGGGIIQENYSGFFQVVSLPVTLHLTTDSSIITPAPTAPFLATGSLLVAGNATQLNLAIMGDSF